MYGMSEYMGLEKTHDMMIKFLNAVQRNEYLTRGLKKKYGYKSEALKTSVLGMDFRNPVGVAAGFDKNAKAIPAIESIGFGFAEVGTVTPRPQGGNEKPRMFKLSKDQGIINRLGFNNDGADKVLGRLDSYDVDIPVGLNIGKMNKSDYEESLIDYREMVVKFRDIPSYYVLNVSCPNTPDKYDERESERLIKSINIVDDEVQDTPVLVKISPDENKESLKSMSKVVENSGVDGIIATNTTEDRPSSLRSRKKSQTGGLSGEPIRHKSNNTIEYLYSSTDVPIIGVGGVSDGRTAYEKIVSGSSLVQLYTGIVYNGLKSSHMINKELESILKSNGFESVTEAVGSEVD